MVPVNWDDCCLCCRPVGTSRTTGCVRTPARASCATTPTFTSSYPTRTESTTLGPRVSRAARVRSSGKHYASINYLSTKNKIEVIILNETFAKNNQSCLVRTNTNSWDDGPDSGATFLFFLFFPKYTTRALQLWFCCTHACFPAFSHRVMWNELPVCPSAFVTAGFSLIINCTNLKRK